MAFAVTVSTLLAGLLLGSPPAEGAAPGSQEASVSVSAQATVGPSPKAPPPETAKKLPAYTRYSAWGLGAHGSVAVVGLGPRHLEHARPQPGGGATLELRVLQLRRAQLFLGGELNYRSLGPVGKAYGARAQAGFRFTSLIGVGGELMGSAGYLHTKLDPVVLQCDCGSRSRRNSALVGAGGGMHYDWGYLTQAPVALFVRYEFMVEAPLGDGVSQLIPYHMLSVGLRFTPLRKKPRRYARKAKD